MKFKISLVLFTFSVIIFSCQPITPEEKSRLKHEIEILNRQEQKVKADVSEYTEELSTLTKQVEEAKQELGVLKSGRQPKYILMLHFQEHKMEVSIDRISFDFEIPVDERFYKESRIGEELGSGSRFFSLGHSGDIQVIGKRIE